MVHVGLPVFWTHYVAPRVSVSGDRTVHTIQYNAMQCSAGAAQHSKAQYNAIQYSTMQYNAVQLQCSSAQ